MMLFDKKMISPDLDRSPIVHDGYADKRDDGNQPYAILSRPAVADGCGESRADRLRIARNKKGVFDRLLSTWIVEENRYPVIGLPKRRPLPQIPLSQGSRIYLRNTTKYLRTIRWFSLSQPFAGKDRNWQAAGQVSLSDLGRPEPKIYTLMWYHGIHKTNWWQSHISHL